MCRVWGWSLFERPYLADKKEPAQVDNDVSHPFSINEKAGKL